MAKRYHNSYKMRDREQYAGREESKLMMAKDGMMIKEDHSAPCLLPKHVIDKDWPRAHNYDMGTNKDLFMGVQIQIQEDENGMRKAHKPGKY